VKIGGQVRTVQHQGVAHATPWDYDARIPLVFYGPGFVREGLTIDAFATQQDLVPTMAHLLDTAAPEDARGRVLAEALQPNPRRRPKAILTVVFDQGGMVNYFDAHPDAFPEIKALMAKGTVFQRARVTHLDAETAVGHTAIGTGAYPAQHGIVANNFWRRDLGAMVPAFWAESPDSPSAILSPTLADVWNRATGNRAIVISYAYAARAAIGMAGHGRFFAKDSRNLVVFYDDKAGKLKTNEQVYTFPPYLASLSPEPYWQKATGGTHTWMGHVFKPDRLLRDLPLTPSFVAFDADTFLAMVEREPVGLDEVPDLLYLTLKSTDACGHAFGAESEECAEVFRAQDAQAGRIVRALEQKVGRNQVVG
jgi:predicted AlkP superfamily pyrophosphatase or phosphodiesterase